MNAEIVIGAGCSAETAAEAEQMLGLLPSFIGLDEAGYTVVYAEGEVSTDVEKWTPEEIVSARGAVQRKGLDMAKNYAEKNPEAGFKVDHGEHQLADGAAMFWFIISENK